MRLPRLLVTGASGFVGRHTIELLRDEYAIVAVARRSQARAGVPDHPNVSWRQADIANEPQLRGALADLGEEGIDAVLHLAAYYDFTGKDQPEYTRTNVEGLRHVLDLAADLGVSRFVFASSLGACRFATPAPLNEASPPDGDHAYARSKRAGEAMVRAYADRFPSVIVRLAALFSDWCEYAPLFVFLNTWLSSSWHARVLGGRGLSAVPFLHVRDAATFFQRVLEPREEFAPGEVLIASPDGATSHRDLFETATLAYYGHRLQPMFLPKALCGPGMAVRDALGRIVGQRPFERPWMARYIDLEMRADAALTRQLLGWAPRSRLGIIRRLPFLVENLRTDPLEWNRRNEQAMKTVQVSDYVQIHWLLQKHESEIIGRFNDELRSPARGERFARYQALSDAEHDWNHRLLLRQLMNAVRTGDKTVFTAYCHDLAQRASREGFTAAEFCGALEQLNLIVLRVLRRDPDAARMRQPLLDYVTMTLRFGCDQAQDTFELAGAHHEAPIGA